MFENFRANHKIKALVFEIKIRGVTFYTLNSRMIDNGSLKVKRYHFFEAICKNSCHKSIAGANVKSNSS